jgi:pimeloyl-ACP methyl ester carboxylesterase
VVFLPGAGLVGLDYLNIHNGVAELTTSVLYDRAGTGWSDRVVLPRTAAEVADELRNLLRAAGVPAPYLLVGHSLGGAYARRFAQRFPDEVAGMLLLDAFHEDWDSHMPEELRLHRQDNQAPPPELSEEQLLQSFRGVFEQKLADWPQEIRELLIDRHLDPERLHIGAQEDSNLAKLADELRQGGNVPDVPLIVLTALAPDPGQGLYMSEQLLRELSDRKRAFYAAVAESVPRGEHRVLEDAAHSTIQFDRPDAVLQAIRDLLDRVDR